MVDNRSKELAYNTIIGRRTIRAFKQKDIPFHILKRLINAARLAPSAANLQPWEFVAVNNKKICTRIFPHLRWAAYIHPLGIPTEGKRPVAYIVVLVNVKKAREEFSAYDVGAAAENILLVAWEQGIGACWMKSIDRDALCKILKIPSYIRLDSVISLGYKDESPKIERLKDSVRYWKDKRGTLHVPKRSLKEILHRNLYKK